MLIPLISQLRVKLKKLPCILKISDLADATSQHEEVNKESKMKMMRRKLKESRLKKEH